MTLVDIRGLAHSYAKTPVLAMPEFTLGEGQHVVVTGPSGSGKTTLLQIIAGLLLPTTGSVMVAGCAWASMTPAQRDRKRGRTTGIVFQSFNLIRAISVFDNLRLARQLAGRKADDVYCRGLLDELGIGRLANRLPARLSRGEAQRAAIARAAAGEPALILADEPTSALDSDNATLVADLLRQRAKAGSTGLVVTTHDERIAGMFDLRVRLNRLP